MRTEYKYLIAHTLPLAAALAVWLGGIMAYAGVILAFVVIPTLDALLKGSTANLTPLQQSTQLQRRLFDWLLYLNLPLLWLITAAYLWRITATDMATYELVGMTLSVGILLGADGINVAHELGHRQQWGEQLLAQLLLIPCLYTHFYIEHNWGHHKHVATPLDPATSRKGQSLYAFFVRSVALGYRSAWQIENTNVARELRPWYRHRMVGFTLVQAIYLATVWVYVGVVGLMGAIAVGVVGFLLLEAVNYIEHYGLLRRQRDNGRYEPVQPHHSWNSNHEVGRIFLYELTRHSDHHFKSTRKYQILRHHDTAPQLPYGYPASILLALVPPLWYRVMDKRVESLNAAPAVV